MMKTFSRLKSNIAKRKSRKTATITNIGKPEVSNDTKADILAANNLKTVTEDGDFDQCNNILPQVDEEIENVEDEYGDIPINKQSPEDLLQHYKENHADEDRLFREEFRKIASEVAKNPPKSEIAKLAINKEKNRYRNIITSDRHRVILKKGSIEDGSDYINASYIDGYTEKRKFIATQGPKPNTINDFWQMVWEQKCQVVVMLTDFKENGKVKCERYWPESGSESYGNITVEVKEIVQYGFVHETKLTLEHESEHVPPLTVTHIWCPKWPDHGIPKTTSELFRLYGIMMISQPIESSSPILVHCSAGVGRSGTLIGLDILLDQLRVDKALDLFAMVVKMRKHRADMVQGMDQYVMLHKLILEHHFLGLTDCEGAKLKYRVHNFNNLESNCSPHMRNGYQYEFSKLSMFPPLNARLGSGRLSHNMEKNRRMDIIPYEHSQVFIRMKPLEMRGPYVNASTIQAYKSGLKLIAAQAPMEHTLVDFWRAIYDNNVTCIVMLSPLESNGEETCPMYWPEYESTTHGDITIQHESSAEHISFIESTLSLTSSTAQGRDKGKRKITHIHFTEWITGETPSMEAISDIITVMRYVDQEKFEMPLNDDVPTVLIHCSDGCGRTGVFCSLLNLIERLRWSNRCDVFRAVKDIRDCRPGMVNSVQEYKLLYRLIETYIASMSSNEESKKTS